MKGNRKKAAVSEIVGVIVLLSMSIAMYSVLQVMVFSYPFQPATPSANLVGSINENNDIIIGHFGGESISADSKIIIRINNLDPDTIIARGSLSPNSISPDLWNIGEFVLIKDKYLTSNSVVHVTIIDAKTNSVVMMGYLQGGSS